MLLTTNFFALILTLLYIFIQDCRERMVYTFLYFLVLIFGFINQLFYSRFEVIITESFINLLLISFILITAKLFSVFFLKKKLINESLGIGDVFMFITLCFAFPVVSFLIFFVCSLLFSLFIHLVSHKKRETIPLAGFMSLFFILVYFTIFISEYNIYKH